MRKYRDLRNRKGLCVDNKIEKKDLTERLYQSFRKNPEASRKIYVYLSENYGK